MIFSKLRNSTLLIDIIFITETWLSPGIPDFNVTNPGYNLFRHDRAHTTGGDECVYLYKKITIFFSL